MKDFEKVKEMELTEKYLVEATTAGEKSL